MIPMHGLTHFLRESVLFAMTRKTFSAYVYTCAISVGLSFVMPVQASDIDLLSFDPLPVLSPAQAHEAFEEVVPKSAPSARPKPPVKLQSELEKVTSQPVIVSVSPIPAKPEVAAVQSKSDPASSPAPLPTSAKPFPQHFNTGDKVRITIEGEPELSGEYSLSGVKGEIDLPLVGKIQAGGLDSKKLQGIVTEAYKNGYLVNPAINVIPLIPAHAAPPHAAP